MITLSFLSFLCLSVFLLKKILDLMAEIPLALLFASKVNN